MILVFTIDKQIITRRDNEKVVRDSVNYLHVNFSFSEEWTGDKTAVFKSKSGIAYNVLVGSDGSCLVPWEVLKEEYFEVSAFCGDLITANVVKVFTIPSGYEIGSQGRIPTPDIYTQIIARLSAIEAEIDPTAIQQVVDEYLSDKGYVTEQDVEQIVSDYIEAHKDELKGEKGDTGATGPQGPQGVQGPKGDTGEGVAAGGTTGEVLIKSSNADYETEWADAFVASKNIFDKNKPNIHNNVYLNANGVETASNSFNVVYMPCEENTTYTVSNVNYSIGLFDSSMNLVRLIRTDETLAYSFTTDAGTSILGVTVDHTNNFNINTFMVIKGDSLPDDYVLGGLVLPVDRIDGLDEVVNRNVYVEQEKQYIDGNIELSWVLGFASITTGTLSNYSTETETYNRSQVVKLNPNRYYRYTGHGKYNAGCCFYTSSNAGRNTFYSVLPEDDYIMFKCPPNAPYIVVSNFTTEYPLENARLEICFSDEYVNNFMKNAHSAKICCTGDSTTEGMGLNGSHYARYGESPYPARLKTILVDNGYDLEVVNQGHGGERMAAIMARIGAEPCTLNEDITILASNTPVSLGTPTVTNGLITGMKMEIPLNDVNGNPYNVSFTQISHDTNPVVIDGTRYTMTLVTIDSNSKKCFIAKETADNKDTVIPSDSIIFTKDDKNPLINIVYAGINDGSGLTFEIWLKGMKECIAANGGKTIVLGATNALFNWWSDLTGTVEQKYAEYKTRATKELGLHFIDLYGEFSRHGVDLALSAGYLTDLTSEEIATMRQKLENHIMPSEFTVDGTENNVHLNEAGYHVIAMLVFERLKLLNYI